MLTVQGVRRRLDAHERRVSLEIAADFELQAMALKQHASLLNTAYVVLGSRSDKCGRMEVEKIRGEFDAYYRRVLQEIGSCILQADAFAKDAAPVKRRNRKTSKARA